MSKGVEGAVGDGTPILDDGGGMAREPMNPMQAAVLEAINQYGESPPERAWEAIAAMRCPTEDMMRAGMAASDGHTDLVMDIWQAMIEAALV